MAYTRIKYSKGRPYLYRVESYREEGKVKQRILQYIGPVNIDSQVQSIKRALRTSDFQEKEMQKRADWNQEGDREMYQDSANREKKEQVLLKKKLAVYERHQKKLGTTYNDKKFLEVVEQSYESSKKLGDMAHVPELTEKIQKNTGLSKEQVHKKLYESYKKKEIDLQPGKGKDSLQSPDDNSKFQYMQFRDKLGTTTNIVNKGLPPKTTGYHPYLGEDGNTYDFEVRNGAIHVVGVRDSKTDKEVDVSIKEIKKKWGWKKVKLEDSR